MYTAIKSLNNNIVLAVDANSEELVLFGKGIGFKKKHGDEVDQTKIEKIFQSKDNQFFSSIIRSITSEVLVVTESLVTLGEEKLNKTLSPSILVSLADHIQCAIDREKEGKKLAESALHWEIPFLYFQEYELGKASIRVIHEELDILLPEMEAAFIALHFVNAQESDTTMDETLLVTEITKSIVKNIQTVFEVSLKKESINYSRFVTHIRYFMNRQLHGKNDVLAINDNLYQVIQEQYPRSYACGLVVREMLQKEYGFSVNDDEMIYLIIHIERVTEESK